MQEALAALNTTIPVLYQHEDFRALLVDIEGRKHCQGPIGVHLCHQLFRLFHARQENHLLGAVETRGSVFHSDTTSVLLECVPWRRLIDIGTFGMSDTFPTFFRNLLFLSLNSLLIPQLSPELSAMSPTATTAEAKAIGRDFCLIILVWLSNIVLLSEVELCMQCERQDDDCVQSAVRKKEVCQQPCK